MTTSSAAWAPCPEPQLNKQRAGDLGSLSEVLSVMEKSYRDLFEELSQRATGCQPLSQLIAAVAQVDDADPLRIAALKAMKRLPPPPINLSYVVESGMLSMYARNTVRKRKATKLALCAQVPAQEWLLNANQAFPGDPELRGRYVELVQRSFGYLEIRIANYFPIGHDSRLTVRAGSPLTLKIKAGDSQEEGSAAP